MPDLDTSLHLDMLNRFKKRKSLPLWILKAVQREMLARKIYGLEWGDPDVVQPLKFVRDRYVMPYIKSDHDAVEVGPGGGRWTRYLLGFRKLYTVDYYHQLLAELKKNFNKPNMVFIKNNGVDFPGVVENSIDYLFSFGTFVHLDIDQIEVYLKNMKSIMKPGANAVIQYSDKTKIMSQMIDEFSDNTPDKMRQVVLGQGYKILEEDTTTMWHSSIVRFTL